PTWYCQPFLHLRNWSLRREKSHRVNWCLTNVCRTCHSIRDGDNRLGPHARNRGKKSWVATRLFVFQRYERRKLRLGREKPRTLHRKPRPDSARQQHEALRRIGIGGEQSKPDYFLEDPCGRSIAALAFGSARVDPSEDQEGRA